MAGPLIHLFSTERTKVDVIKKKSNKTSLKQIWGICHRPAEGRNNKDKRQYGPSVEKEEEQRKKEKMCVFFVVCVYPPWGQKFQWIRLVKKRTMGK